MIRPSSLPMLAQCPCFDGSGGEFAELGTKRHAALAKYYDGDHTLFDALDEESQRGVEWFANYVQVNFPTSEFPLKIEEKREFIGPNWDTITGTPDVTCGLHVGDFKWRRRDYRAQMAAYALTLFGNSFEEVTVHIGYGFECHAEKLVFNQDSAESIVFPIIEAASDPNRKPRPCDYCGWCAKQLTCPVSTSAVRSVALGYSPDNGLGITNWHPSEMETGDQIALALTIWRTIVKKWGESMEYHALDAVEKKGISIPGFELAERKGRQFVSDVLRCYELSNLSPQEFLRVCDVRLNTSKKYPDKTGLDKAIKAKMQFTTDALTKKHIARVFESVISRNKPTKSLRALKQTEENEDTI